MEHTEKCKEATRKYLVALEKFEVEHPHVCKTCNGYGVIDGGYESVPYGMGNAMMPLPPDPCPSCSDKGICPHCGKETLNDENEYAKCYICGWTIEHTPKEMIRPEPPECYCWEEADRNITPYLF